MINTVKFSTIIIKCKFQKVPGGKMGIPQSTRIVSPAQPNTVIYTTV